MQKAPVLVDSGPLYALFDRDDAFNPLARVWFAANRRPLITNAAVTTEVTYLVGALVRSRPPAAVSRVPAAARLAGRGPSAGSPSHPRAHGPLRDLPADFTDASLVALSERLRCTEVATTDRRDFSVYRPAHVERLANPIPLAS
jgi:uncharacterized protein